MSGRPSEGLGEQRKALGVLETSEGRKHREGSPRQRVGRASQKSRKMNWEKAPGHWPDCGLQWSFPYRSQSRGLSH